MVKIIVKPPKNHGFSIEMSQEDAMSLMDILGSLSTHNISETKASKRTIEEDIHGRLYDALSDFLGDYK